MPNNQPAFTAKATGLLNEIILDCGISTPFIPGVTKGIHPPVHQVRSLWDTGATASVITMQTAQKLGLIPTSKSVCHHAGGQSVVNVYLVNIFLPNNVAVPNVRVSECANTNGRFDIIIGMDIISHGDFAITNQGGNTCVSFRMPSSVLIDFTKPNPIITPNAPAAAPVPPVKKAPPVKSGSGQSKNSLCSCGSGKKYKRCHGAEAA